MLDVLKIREDFPMLKKTMHGKPLIYLDNGATTLKPQCVIDSVCDYLTNYSGNAHRGDYDLSHEVDTKFEYVRSIVADFIHCKPEEVVYTYGSSDSLNMVAFGYGMTHLNEGDEILTSDWFWSPYVNISEEVGRKVTTYQLLDENNNFNFNSFKEKFLEAYSNSWALFLFICGFILRIFVSKGDLSFWQIVLYVIVLSILLIKIVFFRC